MGKMKYEKPQMYAETFIANQYVAACQEPMYEVKPTQVRCETPGHRNTQYTTMFTDRQNACVALFVPHVGSADGDKFHTQFEACAYFDGCNRNNYNSEWPHWLAHGVTDHEGFHPGAFINHDTTIDLSTARKYNLS